LQTQSRTSLPTASASPHQATQASRCPRRGRRATPGYRGYLHQATTGWMPVSRAWCHGGKFFAPNPAIGETGTPTTGEERWCRIRLGEEVIRPWPPRIQAPQVVAVATAPSSCQTAQGRGPERNRREGEEVASEWKAEVRRLSNLPPSCTSGSSAAT
jgi:hypothetical protein